MRVSLFITCLCDMFASDVGKDSVELLERFGCKIDFPKSQTCCGQPAYNSGYLKESKESMKQMMRAFKDSEYVVAPSGSCIAMFKEYPHIFAGDSEWEAAAKDLASKSYEITQFIMEVLKIEDVGASLPGKGTYHPSCHMTRLLGVKDGPLKMLSHVKGLEMVELPNKEDCCGFGGTFAVKNPVISEQMVQEKTEHILETEAEYLIGGDMGCLMNMGGRLTRNGKPVKVMHIVSVLNSRV
ncbi:(Fe-S)-binding protein [Bacillaceae bacterium S4-13-56]